MDLWHGCLLYGLRLREPRGLPGVWSGLGNVGVSSRTPQRAANKACYHCKFFHREEEEGADTAGASRVSLVWELGSPEPVEGSVRGARGSGCGWQRGTSVFSTWNLNFEEFGCLRGQVSEPVWAYSRRATWGTCPGASDSLEVWGEMDS